MHSTSLNDRFEQLHRQLVDILRMLRNQLGCRPFSDVLRPRNRTSVGYDTCHYNRRDVGTVACDRVQINAAYIQFTKYHKLAMERSIVGQTMGHLTLEQT